MALSAPRLPGHDLLRAKGDGTRRRGDHDVDDDAGRFLGKLTKPFALAIRLFANMNAGGCVILALVGLIVLAVQASGLAAVSLVGPLAMAVPVMVLENFVAFLLAYIFSMLTSVFIGLIRHAE